MEIRDIKPMLPMEDLTFYYVAGSFLFIVLLIFVYYLASKKRVDEAKERLKSLDLSDSKKSAYEITRYGKKLITEQNKELFFELEYELKKYKYVKNPPSLNERSKELIALFLESL